MASQSMVCSNCGSTGRPKTYVQGSFLIELLLWLMFLLPGVIYSLWRLTTKKRVCSVCGASNMLPADSPVAQRIVYEQAKSRQSQYKTNIEDPIDKWEREQQGG
jgi:hypothetical protein